MKPALAFVFIATISSSSYAQSYIHPGQTEVIYSSCTDFIKKSESLYESSKNFALSALNGNPFGEHGMPTENPKKQAEPLISKTWLAPLAGGVSMQSGFSKAFIQGGVIVKFQRWIFQGQVKPFQYKNVVTGKMVSTYDTREVDFSQASITEYNLNYRSGRCAPILPILNYEWKNGQMKQVHYSLYSY